MESVKRPDTLLLYLEKEKFPAEVYAGQMARLKELEKEYAAVLELGADTADAVFTEARVENSLCLTSSDALAEQLRHLGYAVVGWEADGERMRVPPVVIEDLRSVSSQDLARMFQRQRGIPWEILETERSVYEMIESRWNI